jgi:hypothetical protein
MTVVGHTTSSPPDQASAAQPWCRWNQASPAATPISQLPEEVLSPGIAWRERLASTLANFCNRSMTEKPPYLPADVS